MYIKSSYKSFLSTTNTSTLISEDKFHKHLVLLRRLLLNIWPNGKQKIKHKIEIMPCRQLDCQKAFALGLSNKNLNKQMHTLTVFISIIY